MKHLKLKASTNSRSAAIAALTFWLVAAASADAWAGKRVVVLDFDGPQAESFHGDVERIVKKAFVLVPVGKWNKAAEANEIERLSEKNVKMLCKKVGVDGVVSGKIEKRRDEYIVRLKLRECSSGEMVGNPIDVKASGPRLDGGASRTLREELTDAIATLSSGGGGDDDGGGGDDADADEPKKPKFGGKVKNPDADDDADVDADEPKKPVKGKKPPVVADADDDDADVVEPKKPVKGKKPPVVADADDDDVVEPKKPVKGKKPVAVKADPPPVDDDEPKGNADADDEPLTTPKPKKPKKVVASEDNEGEIRDGDGGDDASPASAANLSWSQRAVDAKLGLSFMRRTMSFTSSLPAENQPAEYKGPPAPAAYLDVTIFPMAIGHKRKGIIKDIGLAIGFDRVLKLQSSVEFLDGMATKSAKVATTSQRFTIGAVFRHAFGAGVTAPVVTAGLRYSSKKFALSTTGLPDGAIDLPNVAYSSIDPSLSAIYPISPKLAVNAGFGAMLISKTGQIQNTNQYGPAKVLGLELEAGVDYLVTKAIFVHAGVSLSTVGFTFKGQGDKTTMRDMDMDVDVTAARDTYLGGVATAGFTY